VILPSFGPRLEFRAVTLVVHPFTTTRDAIRRTRIELLVSIMLPIGRRWMRGGRHRLLHPRVWVAETIRSQPFWIPSSFLECRCSLVDHHRHHPRGMAIRARMIATNRPVKATAVVMGHRRSVGGMDIKVRRMITPPTTINIAVGDNKTIMGVALKGRTDITAEGRISRVAVIKLERELETGGVSVTATIKARVEATVGTIIVAVAVAVATTIVPMVEGRSSCHHQRTSVVQGLFAI